MSYLRAARTLLTRRPSALLARIVSPSLSIRAAAHSQLRLPCSPIQHLRQLSPRPRLLSTTAPAHNTTPSTSTQSFPDPDRPELFYHLYHPPSESDSAAPVFALSFLPHAPASVRSATIIGWLPAAAPGADDAEAGLNDFMENPSFRTLLHEAIQSALVDGADDVQSNAAIQTQQGWMHIHDNRNVPALGRIGDPDDIIASVRVEDGKIMSETYQPMPSYRLCTADGVLQLTEGLAQRLQEVLETRAAAEAKEKAA